MHAESPLAFWIKLDLFYRKKKLYKEKRVCAKKGEPAFDFSR